VVLLGAKKRGILDWPLGGKQFVDFCLKEAGREFDLGNARGFCLGWEWDGIHNASKAFKTYGKSIFSGFVPSSACRRHRR